MADPAVRVILVTVPGAEAPALARAVVEEGLAACANLVPSVTSVYRWKGRVEEEMETLMILKTSESRIEELKSRVRKLHSYDVPEFLVLSVTDGLGAYLEWIHRETGEGVG